MQKMRCAGDSQEPSQCQQTLEKLWRFSRLKPDHSNVSMSPRQGNVLGTEGKEVEMCFSEEPELQCTSSPSPVTQTLTGLATSHAPADVPMVLSLPHGSVPSSKTLSAGSSKQYTPLEQQYLGIKSQHPDTILLVECGYKYKFFGEDAEIASKELNIGCFPDHNFMASSIPTHRLNVHVRRLVLSGYKVGVVKQTETAALKAASSHRSGPFSRELTALYTRSTLFGDDLEGRSQIGGTAQEEEGLYMMCLCEGRLDRQRNGGVALGFFVVAPCTGKMVYDEFMEESSCSSSVSYTRLESRLSHIQPVEILYPEGISGGLEDTLIEWKRLSGVSGLRLEKLPDLWFDYNDAFALVTQFYGGPLQRTADDTVPQSLKLVLGLPSTSLSCLGVLIRHLTAFKLERVLKLTSNMEPFSVGTFCMRLTSNTLENLEIFTNNADRTEKGSLFWVLNHTRTPFGKRLLRNWVSYPLRNIKQIRQRQEAVGELSTTESPCLSLLTETLSKLPDLEKMLCAAYHRKCSPCAFYVMVRALAQLHSQLQDCAELALTDLKATLLQQALKEVPVLLEGSHSYLEALNESAAREVKYECLFADPEQFPAVAKEIKVISDLKQNLLDYRKQFRKTLGYPTLDYVTVCGVQYLVEVKNKDLNKVPSDWTRISGTKRVARFHPPYISEAVRLLAQHSDQLRICAKVAWDDFLNDFSKSYGAYKRAVDLLAMVDCLISLAEVAGMPGYVCPTVVEEPTLEIKDGRHPIIDQMMGEGEQYVPNDTRMSASGLRTMIITGPNMGGKSCYIKQVGLLCIMAQIGSYIPATSATLGNLDAVYTRMGARDSLYTGKSTFMVELMEASEIIRLATPSSLVILDELGRGTSTHDGTAVAYATLAYFTQEVKCMTLFVTHYPLLANLEQSYPQLVGNFHMAYMSTEDSSDEYERVVFLYELVPGRAGKSYGLNVAALAGLSDDILGVAREKSRELRLQTADDTTLQLSNSSTDTFRQILSLLTYGSPVSLSEDLKSAISGATATLV